MKSIVLFQTYIARELESPMNYYNQLIAKYCKSYQFFKIPR